MKPVYGREKAARPIDSKETGAAVRKYRRKAGVSVQFLAEALKCSESYIYMLEQGHRVWTQELLDRVVAAIDGKTKHGKKSCSGSRGICSTSERER